MTATPAQVANDLVLQAEYVAKRDAQAASACRDCARMIRAFLAGEKVDRLDHGDVHLRLTHQLDRFRNRHDTQIGKSLRRGLATLQLLHGQLVRAAQ